MGRSTRMSVSVLLVVGLSCLLLVDAQRPRPPRPPVGGGTETNASGSVSADVGYVHLMSCSGVIVGGVDASAYSGAIAVGLDQAAAGCATAFADAISQNCNGNAYVSAFTVAESCASALASLYVESWVSVYTEEDSIACAQSCASGVAAAESYSTAFSSAFTDAFNGCSEVAAYVESEVFSKVFVQVMGSVFSNACAENGGSAEGGASAFIKTAASSFAVAWGDVWGYACTEGCLGSCGYCSLTTEDYQATDAYGYISGGTYSLAEAMGQTVHAACNEGRDVTTADVDVLVEAYVSFCLKLVGTLNNWVDARPRGEAWVCTSSDISSNIEYAAHAMAYGWAWAWRKNFDDCGYAFSDSVVEAFASDVVNVAFNAYQTVCSEYGRRTKTTHVVKEVLDQVDRAPFATAIAYAYAEVANNCPCSNSCFCPCHCGGGDCKCSLFD
eukprot:CAMPEP_0198330266 /NCGR_PEP_ID=MMETSP1450-20131203/16787_1 /TAXON_ID=753684 ORGANISM="Madagascaria erythrocladiodes, Strain CCMP3234" /NCGR_SAMPLE_ID=MMETSP1450 /ASSEMBLY_ACC=CAM_ASM_001115 /LENGTH=441 /DNA_ID=CAMNT_0044034543 /DNA_START=465 /DNA_END=1790 /DNA_ORIENTATION=-